MPALSAVPATKQTDIPGHPTAITPAKTGAEAANGQSAPERRNLHVTYPTDIILRKTVVKVPVSTMVPVKPMTAALTARKAAVSPLTDIPILKNAKAPALITVLVRQHLVQAAILPLIKALQTAVHAAPTAGHLLLTENPAAKSAENVGKKLARAVTLQA